MLGCSEFLALFELNALIFPLQTFSQHVTLGSKAILTSACSVLASFVEKLMQIDPCVFKYNDYPINIFSCSLPY